MAKIPESINPDWEKLQTYIINMMLIPFASVLAKTLPFS